MRSRLVRRPRAACGSTLLELLFSAAIFAALVAPLVMLTVTGASVASDTTARGDAEARARRALSRVTELLSAATWNSVSTYSAFPSWGSTISYDAVTTVTMTNGTLTLRGMRIEWQRDPADADDGKDNDKDGLVDEGHVLVTHDVGLSSQRSVVILRRVPELLEGESANGLDDNGNGLIDECGFAFTREARAVTVHVTVASNMTTGGQRLETATTSIRARN